MGGNRWTSTGPYQQDLAVAFRGAQEAEPAGDGEPRRIGYWGVTAD
ncbi:hypothetical protein ACFQ9Z_21045 [Streptomyces sp. NPDC056580]